MTARGVALLPTGRQKLTICNYRRSFSHRNSYLFGWPQAAAEENMEADRDLFKYTSGSYNEGRRQAERHLAFNIEELKKAAARVANKPITDVESVRKLSEGGFNRIFEISMRAGSPILARLPYPSTLPRRFVTASEVATLDFVRVHGIPAPRVLEYSVDDNPVGSEYILMEKLPGRPLGDTWFELPEKDRLKVLLEIVKLEAKLFALSLPASGSIYYARDLSPNIPKVHLPGSEDGLCIGPYAALRWWFKERADLAIDRGPHDDPLLAIQAPAEKELAWIHAYGQPRYPFERAYRETFHYRKQGPAEHANSLLDYLRLAPHLVPTCSELNRAILRHPDLQPNNIFVSEDFTITGLIDWQHSSVLPAFVAAGIPGSLQNYSDKQSMSFVPPQLPENFESMHGDERAKAYEQFRRRHVHFFYLAFTQRMNMPHWEILEQETGLLKRRIFDDAGSPWEGLNTPLQVDIARVSQNWPRIATANPDGTIPECPVEVSEQDMHSRAALEESLRDVDSEMERINGVLGIASDGWTSNEQFAEAKKRAQLVKEEGLAAVDDDMWLREMTEKHWPFDDFNEDE